MTDEITKTQPGGVIDPAQYADMTGDDLDAGESVQPYLQVVQGLSSSELKDEFGEGSVILQPASELLCAKDGSFLAVPVYQWLSWRQVRDLDDTTGEHFIMVESFDKDSAVAQRANDWDGKIGGRTQEYGDGWESQFLTCIHLAMLTDAGPVIQTFQKGGFKDGQRLYNRLRKLKKDGESQPLFSRHVEFSVESRKSPKGKGSNHFLIGMLGELTDVEKWPEYAALYQECRDNHLAAKAAESEGT